MDVPLQFTDDPDLSPTFPICPAQFDAPPSPETFEAEINRLRKLWNAAPPGLARADVTSITAGRATLLAAHSRPVWTIFSCDDDGRTPTGADVLAAFIVMEGMGCTAFGLRTADPAILKEQYDRLLPYATVPLLWPSQWPAPPLTQLPGTALRDPDVIPCASGTEARFLTPDVDVGETLRCGPDLLEEIVESEENRPQGALKIAILSEDDLFSFAAAQYAIRDALCIWSDVPELLEQALRLYQGRAFWDGTEDLPDDFLQYLSRTYGLILL